MQPFSEILMIGGHANSLGKAQDVLEILKKDPSRLDELFKCISNDDAWVRMRAIDTFEKIVKDAPSLARPYLDEIFSIHIKSDQASIQWHLAQIFTEVELTSKQRNDAIAWLKMKISTTNVDWIVSANAMKALHYFYTLGLVGSDELRTLYEKQCQHSSKSVRKKATQLITEIDGHTVRA